RHSREDRPTRGEVLVELRRRHVASALTAVGKEQEERVRVALQLEGPPPGSERRQLEAVSETEAARPREVCLAKIADEASVRDAVDAGERTQEGPRVATAEEAPGVRDPEAIVPVVRKSGEVLEIGAVRDDGHVAARVERPHLGGDLLRDGDDRVRAPGDRP